MRRHPGDCPPVWPPARPSGRSPIYGHHLCSQDPLRVPIQRWTAPPLRRSQEKRATPRPTRSSLKSTTPSRERPSSSATATGYWWSIRRPCLSPRRNWTAWPSCPTSGNPTPCMTRWGACPPSRRCASPSPTTGAALGRATSAPWPSTRGGHLPRSHETVLREAEALTRHPGFKGYIHDVGGPTANFRRPSCKKQLKHGMCRNRACLAPKPCPNLDADHTDYFVLLRKLRQLPGVKKVFIRSGIRFDYCSRTPAASSLPSWCSTTSPASSRWPPSTVLSAYWTTWASRTSRSMTSSRVSTSAEPDVRQGAVPGALPDVLPPGLHPGRRGAAGGVDQPHRPPPEQVQDFYPTPGTLSTCMYYTGL